MDYLLSREKLSPSLIVILNLGRSDTLDVLVI